MKILAAVLLTLLSALSGSAAAQAFPSRPVRLIVPYPAASTSDIIARVLAQKLQEIWRQPVLTENRPGASAMIGSDLVAKSPPDGHVLLLGGAQSHAMNVATIKKMLYDPVRDFTPITQTTRANWLIAVHPSIPARAPKDLIALVRSNPGKFTYGSSGTGGVSHLAFEMLSADFGLQIVHSPYKGGPPAAADLAAGRIQMMMGDQATLLALVRSGRINAIAWTGNVRAASLPNIPTIAETLVPGFDVQAWQGIWAPAAINPSLRRQLHEDFLTVLRMPDVVERLQGAGLETVGSATDEFESFIQRETRFWTAAARKAGIEPE